VRPSCSFWLVSALATIGETRRARDLMERLLKTALVEAGARIILAEGLAEANG
jgi:hypothetical protein